MKIIQEPVQYVLNNAAAQLNAANRRVRGELNEEISLKPKYRPANYSGPPHLEQLNGKCFDYLNNKYRFTLYFILLISKII